MFWNFIFKMSLQCLFSSPIPKWPKPYFSKDSNVRALLQIFSGDSTSYVTHRGTDWHITSLLTFVSAARPCPRVRANTQWPYRRWGQQRVSKLRDSSNETAGGWKGVSPSTVGARLNWREAGAMSLFIPWGTVIFTPGPDHSEPFYLTWNV